MRIVTLIENTEEMDEIRNIAEALKQYDTVFYTCHCTGMPAYEEMKKVMRDRLKYVHTGDEVII